jgi:hypothetical protein
MADYFEKKIDVLISAHKDACARTRSVFLTTNVAITICAVVILNSVSFLFERDFNEKSEITKGLICSDDFKAVLAKETAFIQIPIIGIKVCITDLGMITCFTMAILSTWFYFSVRRERLIVTEVYSDLMEFKSKSDGEKNEPHLIDYVHQGLVNQSIFSTSTNNDYLNKKDNLHKKNSLGRFFVNAFLMYSPLIIIITVMVRDLYLLQIILRSETEIHIPYFLVKNILLPCLGFFYCLIQISRASANETEKQENLLKIFWLKDSTDKI